MEELVNSHRGVGLPRLGEAPSTDAEAVAKLLALCPCHAPTRLRRLVELDASAGVGALWIKDERTRMGLGAFKALGAAYAIAREAAAVVADTESEAAWKKALEGRTFVTASAGNHGLSVAAGARLFGADSVVVLAKTVPEAFAERLRAFGARVAREGETYEDSMSAATRMARANGWILLSDSSWPGYTEMPYRVMEGYLQMGTEIAEDLAEPPTHILLQAGVGGLAAALAAQARAHWGDAPEIVVVEPAAAPALIESVRAGQIIETEGPVSAMGRLDCKTPSMIALAGLARDADRFVTITEAEADHAVTVLAAAGLETTPSGAAGIAALLAGVSGMGRDARVLAILSEGPESA